MIGVDKIGEIRRAYFEQHRSIKEIVRILRCRARRYLPFSQSGGQLLFHLISKLYSYRFQITMT